ncbi:MAG: SGNH/GDSL hydrolase family protein [Flavisolibacter sp.]
MHIYTYLALGDSYTIGEGVPLTESFPYQVVQLLRQKEYDFNAPEIIAKTGWTTDELQLALGRATLLSKYDFVTLLIGVNNQYRGRDAIEYKEQFEELLKKAIELANGKKDRVIIVSIPDYGVTPHGRSMDAEKISKEIEVFNSINKALSIQYKVLYTDVTLGSRQNAGDTSLVAIDGLHPSGKEYRKWAEKIVELIVLQLK